MCFDLQFVLACFVFDCYSREVFLCWFILGFHCNLLNANEPLSRMQKMYENKEQKVDENKAHSNLY